MAALQNLLNACVGCVVWLTVGDILATAPGFALFGWNDFLLTKHVVDFSYAPAMFRAAFATVASSIISGSVPERIDTRGYVVLVILTTGLVYPVVSRSIWHPMGTLLWLLEPLESLHAAQL